jgi:hypothetical protein
MTKHNGVLIMKVKDLNVYQKMTVRLRFPWFYLLILTQPVVIHLKLVVIKKEWRKVGNFVVCNAMLIKL